MKVFGKYLLINVVDGQRKIASSFMTKKDAIEALDACIGVNRLEDNLWEDKSHNVYFIEKNTKEYR